MLHAAALKRSSSLDRAEQRPIWDSQCPPVRKYSGVVLVLDSANARCNVSSILAVDELLKPRNAIKRSATPRRGRDFASRLVTSRAMRVRRFGNGLTQSSLERQSWLWTPRLGALWTLSDHRRQPAPAYGVLSIASCQWRLPIAS